MAVAVIGGGILGLALAHRLAKLGQKVELFEAAPELGGLAAPQAYGPFTWDRYYHCILPQDTQLLGLLREIGLGDEFRWQRTGTGYYAGGRFYSMSGNADFLRFPLLSFSDKFRLGATVLHATKTARPLELYGISAQDWLIRWCGRRGYETFWQPLLKAKFGPYHDQVAAVFIWATLTRLQGARQGSQAREQLGYVSGGYARILSTFRRALEEKGAVLRTGAPATSIERDGAGARLSWGGKDPGSATFEHVIFTGPTRMARRVTHPSLIGVVEEAERRYPTAGAYLGVACLNLVLKRPLTPYYVLNIADSSVELTGLIEMTNLIDPPTQTKGHSLIYLPRYLDSADPAFEGPPDPIVESLYQRGVQRLFPSLSNADVVDRQLHRARFVQPLPLVRHAVEGAELPGLTPPLTLLNTSMLQCATLNNNEVVGLVDRFTNKNLARLAARRGPLQPAPAS
jgi:protoporphyrinogen oxidase